MKSKCFIYLIFIVLFCSCSTYKNIEPIGKDNFKANLDFGGPIVTAFNTKVPIPYLSIGVSYGLNENTNLNANLHLLPMFYKLGGIDLGVTYFPLLNEGLIPTIGINGTLMLFSSLKSGIEDRFRAYPIITPSFAWKLGTGLIYTGVHSVLPITKLDFADNNSIIISPFVGYRWELSNAYKLYTEFKWQGINIETDKTVVEYIHPNNQGAIGIYLTLERSF